MKKTLVTCSAIVAMLAIAGSAFAITCTVDKRPAATLLVPYFASSFNTDGSVDGTGIDTIVTIANASSAPMIAHVNVFNKRSELVLDFNVALTGFDVQAMRMSDVISGHLPTTGDFDSKGNLIDACQRSFTECSLNGYQFLRIGVPGSCSSSGLATILPAPATSLDNTRATTLYPTGGAFSFADAFGQSVLDSLDQTSDTNNCGGVDGVVTGPAEGYVTIDMVNYCNLSDPTDPNYYIDQALGFENNLWGDVVFETGSGVGTYAGSLVHVEADTSQGNRPNNGPDDTGLVQDFHTDVQCPTVPCVPDVRTFYARYVTPAAILSFPNPGINANAPWDRGGWGDMREPLGLKYAARWINAASSGLTSNFSVWRASANDLTNLLNSFETTGKSGGCKDIETTVNLTFWDEDENLTTTGPCPSPCQSSTFNFPLESQRTNIVAFAGALPSAPAGWVNMEFSGSGFTRGGSPDNFGGDYDQAYVLYDWEGPAAFLSFQDNAAQLDTTNCNPIGVPVFFPNLIEPHTPGDSRFFFPYGVGGDPHIVGTGN